MEEATGSSSWSRRQKNRRTPSGRCSRIRYPGCYIPQQVVVKGTEAEAEAPRRHTAQSTCRCNRPGLFRTRTDDSVSHCNTLHRARPARAPVPSGPSGRPSLFLSAVAGRVP